MTVVFYSPVAPVVVSALPAPILGGLVFLTTDGKTYFSDGASWAVWF